MFMSYDLILCTNQGTPNQYLIRRIPPHDFFLRIKILVKDFPTAFLSCLKQKKHTTDPPVWSRVMFKDFFYKPLRLNLNRQSKDLPANKVKSWSFFFNPAIWGSPVYLMKWECQKSSAVCSFSKTGSIEYLFLQFYIYMVDSANPRLGHRALSVLVC